MSNPTGTPETPEEPTERTDQPIDPTRTFDAYFDPQTPTTPAAPVPQNDDLETDFTEPDPDPVPAERSSTESFAPESASAKTDFTKPVDPPSYSQSDWEPEQSEPEYPAQAFTGTTKTVPAYAPSVSETVSPEAYSVPSEATVPAGPTGTTAGFGASPDQTAAPEPRAVRMRTVVFGLVLLVIAGAVLVGQLTDVTVDAGAVLLALMIGGGLLLIAGARRT